ncbi:MAG: cytochrome c oxidase subunit 3 [Chloroflexota bacterium]|nr:cytochrome c oxidase subunit 3 [Chloroflexota bacterium]
MTDPLTPSQPALTRDERIALANRRFGLLIFQVSWILVFVLFFVVNLQIRANFPSWPPPGVPALNALLPTIATVALIASGLLAGRALTALRAGRREAFLKQWRTALAIGIAFVIVMAYEWIAIPFSEQFSTLFRVMTAFHAVHALVIAALMWHILRRAGDGVSYGVGADWAVEGTVKLWYFVVAAWLLFYSVLYVI